MSLMKKGLWCVLAGILLVGLGGCGGSVDTGEYMERARDALDRGAYRQATIELKNALSLKSDNPEARLLLGETYYTLGEIADAAKELRRALDLGVAADAVLPRLSWALLRMGDREGVLALPMDGMRQASARAAVYAARALALQGQGRNEVAAAELERALQLDERRAEVVIARGLMLAGQGRIDAALEVVDALLAREPSHAQALGLKGDLLARKGAFDQALAAYSRAVEVAQDDGIYRLHRAQLALRQGDVDAARADLEVLLRLAPDNPEVRQLEGTLLLTENRLDEARVALERAIRVAPDHPRANFQLGWIHFRQGNPAAAEQYLRRFLKRVPESRPGRKLLAAVLLAEGRAREAEPIARKLVESGRDDPEALDLLANALLEQKRPEEALDLLRRVAELRPDVEVAALRLAMVLLSLGREDEGLAALERAEALAKDPVRPLLVRVRHLLSRDRVDAAREALRARPEAVRQDPRLMLAEALVALRGGDREAAVERLERVLAEQPGHVAAGHLLAAIRAEQGDLQAAKAVLEQVLEAHPRHATTLVQLGRVEIALGDKASGERRLEQAIEIAPKALLPRILLARQHLVSGHPDRVGAVLVGLDDRGRKHPAVMELAALAALRQGRAEEALFQLDRLIDRFPERVEYRVLRAQAYAVAGELERALATLDEVIAKAPDHFLAHLAAGRIALALGRQSRVEQAIEALRRLRPGQPDVLALEAALARQRGDAKTAESLHEKLFETVPGTETLLGLIRARWESGDHESAVELARQWVAQHPDDVRTPLVLASAFMATDRTEEVVAQYRLVLERDPNNVVALNNLAWVLREQDPAQALEYAERAHRLAPELPEVLDTLAMVLLAHGETERAARMIRRALARKPDAVDFRWHQVQIDLASGRREQAYRRLRSLLDGAAAFEDREEAEALLERLEREMR